MSTPTPAPLSPDAFSPLPELSTILSRLRPPPSSTIPNPLGSSSSPTAPSQQPTPSGPVGTGTTPLPSTAPATTTTTATTTTAAAAAATTSGPLSLKEVPAATDPIKHKLQRARQQVRALPDIDRTVADQEREIDELQARIRRQKEVLRLLREAGLRFGAAAAGDDGVAGAARKEEDLGQGEGAEDMVMR